MSTDFAITISLIAIVGFLGWGLYSKGYSDGMRTKQLTMNQEEAAKAFNAARARCFIHWHDQAPGKQYSVDTED